MNIELYYTSAKRHRHFSTVFKSRTEKFVQFVYFPFPFEGITIFSIAYAYKIQSAQSVILSYIP